MSDTPRTDAQFKAAIGEPFKYTREALFDFARTLERELAAAQARLAHHQATFEYIAGYFKGLPDQRWARYMAKRQHELEAMP